jgi:CxxH/CxxC protein (TIGR04129 family)
MYACQEHIDYVMEDFIDKYSVAPTMELLDKKEQKKCDWCDQPADYLLKTEEGEESVVAD